MKRIEENGIKMINIETDEEYDELVDLVDERKIELGQKIMLFGTLCTLVDYSNDWGEN